MNKKIQELKTFLNWTVPIYRVHWTFKRYMKKQCRRMCLIINSNVTFGCDTSTHWKKVYCFWKHYTIMNINELLSHNIKFD